MQNREITRQHQKLKDLLSKTKELEDKPIEFQSHWAKYLCVYVAGFIETSIQAIFLQYTQDSVSGPVVNYTSSMLKKIQNPKTRKIVEIAGTFKKEWGNQLEQFVNDDGRKEAIDSIMANRHLIAHGKDVGISIVRVNGYLEKVLAVLEFTERQCNDG